MVYDKNTIAEAARKGLITVVFTKTNGDQRTMRCTLQAEYLPAKKDIEEATTATNPNILAVWDVEANGWRSFRIDRIISVAT